MAALKLTASRISPIDGVFQGDNVLLEVGVDVLDHGRQRGGLAAAGRAGDQHDSARRFGDVPDLFEQAQFREAGHMGFDVTHRQAPLAALLEQIGAEPPDSRNEVGEIGLALVGDAPAQVRRRDCLDDLVDPLLSGQRTLDGDKLAMNAENYRAADLQMHVGRSAFHGRFQNALE